MNTIEKKYVYDTYQIISRHFDTTRSYLWKGVKDFLDSIPRYSFIVEVGSGNGKNLLRRPDCINIGIDLCPNFSTITKEKGIESITANNLSIPIKSNSIDVVLSVAVIHHLSTHERRLECIKELIRIIKPNGTLFIQVWAMEQTDNSRNIFKKKDNYVEFNSPDKSIKEWRFYHVFSKGELENLVKDIENIDILTSVWEHGNWIMIIKKTF